MPRLGAHVSASGGVARVFERGAAIGCDSLQVFVKSPNAYVAKPLKPEDVRAFRDAWAERPGVPVVAHGAYLINMCAQNPDTLTKSRKALADELRRCSDLGIPGLVVHPGAHMGAGEACGLDGIAETLDVTFRENPGLTTRVLLENTAGTGTTLGARFADLAGVLERLDEPERVGMCLDTCHAFAAGYDLRAADGWNALLEELDGTVGLARLACLHLNDSQHPLGSRKDRHANIGEGEIGEGAFAVVLADERMAGLPMILETPLGDDEEGHRRDLERLRALRG